MTLIWTSQARRDQVEIYETIAADNQSAAERHFWKIEDHIALLERSPFLGVAKLEYGAGARMLVEGPYVILYRVLLQAGAAEVDTVTIVRIVHGGRNMDKLFGKR